MLRPILRNRRPAPACIAALILSASGLATGCTDGRSAAAGDRSPVQLSIAYADPRFDAGRAGLGLNNMIMRLSSEGLVSTGPDGRAEPRLAERWSQSADGLEWRFHLRRSVTFHDGTPLTASSVRTALEEQISAARDRNQISPGLRDIVSLEDPSPDELVVRLSRRNTLLPEALREMRVEGRGGAQRAGPFRLVSKTDEGAVLDAYPGYHRGRPRIDRVNIRGFQSARTAWGAMLRDEVDVVYDIAPDAIDFVEQSSTAYVAAYLRPFVVAVVWNMRHPILRRTQVRHALSAGVDRAEIISGALNGRGRPAGGALWPRHWAYDTASDAQPFDPARAVRLLDEAGLRPGAVRASAPSPRLTFTCLIFDGDPRFERVGLIVQRQLVELGVNMRLEAVSLPVLVKRVGTGDYDAFLFEMAGLGFDWLYWFWQSDQPSRLILSGYDSADAALDRLRGAASDDALQAAMRDVQVVLGQDPPAVFLYWTETARAVSRRFVVPDPLGRDILMTLPQWRLAQPSVR